MTFYLEYAVKVSSTLFIKSAILAEDSSLLKNLNCLSAPLSINLKYESKTGFLSLFFQINDIAMKPPPPIKAKTGSSRYKQNPIAIPNIIYTILMVLACFHYYYMLLFFSIFF